MRASASGGSMPAALEAAGGNGGGNGADLAQLQREYRNMEMNRRVYADESHQVMRRQQAVIDKLKKDNDDMKHELLLATRHLTESSAQAQQEQLARVSDQLEGFAKKNGAEAKRLETLTHQIQVMRHKVLHQKKHMGGVNAARENQQMVSKQIRILENRLDKSLVKFNEALAQNKVLREEIDNLRRERVAFDAIYRKLEREHNDKKKQMAATIEVSNLSYEQRDAAQLELRALQEQSRLEAEAHRRALGDLMDKMDEARARGEDAFGKRGASPLAGGRMGDLSLEEELEMKKKIQKGTWGVAKEKVHVQVSIERVQNFEEAFQKIKAATRIDDLEELVAAFIKKEDQNFSLFNYVNEQTNELEKLEEWIAALREEEKKYSDEGSNGDVDGGGQHRQLLRELESKLQATEQAADRCEAKCQEAQQIVGAVKGAIQSLFARSGCDAQQMVEMLGDAVVTEANMMAYLGVIEERANDILHQYAALQLQQQQQQKLARSKHTSEAYDKESQFASNVTGHRDPNTITESSAVVMQSVLGIGPVTPMGQDPLQINPPNLEDYSSEDEDSGGDNDDTMHPLTRDELKVRTLKGLRRLNHATGTTASRDVRRANHLNGAGSTTK